MNRRSKQRLKELIAYLVPTATFGGGLLLKLKVASIAPIWFVALLAIHWFFSRDTRANEKAISDYLTQFLVLMKFDDGADIRCTVWLPIKDGTQLQQAVHYLPAGKIGKGRIRQAHKGVCGLACQTKKTECTLLTDDICNDPSRFRDHAKTVWHFSDEEAHMLDGTRKAYLAVPVLGEGARLEDREILGVIYCDSNRKETFSNPEAVKNLADSLVPFFRYLFT